MDNQQYVAQTPNWMIYPEAQPEKPKTSKKVIILIPIIILLCVLVAVSAIVITNMVGKKEGNDKPITDSGIDTKEYIVRDIALIQAFVTAANTGSTISQAQCRSLIEYGNKFVEAYGDGKKVSNNICDGSSINVAMAQENHSKYPYEKMTILYLQVEKQCLKFPFYEDLYSMQDYEVLDTCPIATKTIKVTQ